MKRIFYIYKTFLRLVLVTTLDRQYVLAELQSVNTKHKFKVFLFTRRLKYEMTETVLIIDGRLFLTITKREGCGRDFKKEDT
jgi:hypothetical protein